MKTEIQTDGHDTGDPDVDWKRTAERLRAVVDAQHDLILAQDKDRAELRGRAERAEARLAKVVEFCRSEVEHGESFSKERGFAATMLEIAAAQPEEKSRYAGLAVTRYWSGLMRRLTPEEKERFNEMQRDVAVATKVFEAFKKSLWVDGRALLTAQSREESR